MRRELTARERRGAALIVLALAVWAGWWLLVQSWFLGPLLQIENQADSLRPAVTAGSIWRSEPAPLLRGLAYSASPASSRSSLMAAPPPHQSPSHPACAGALPLLPTRA